jgi:hypothetical protein
MPYNNQYSLELYDKNMRPLDESGHDIIKHLREINPNFKYAIDEYGVSNEECGWYAMDEDMTDLSKLYPNVIFRMLRIGEEGEQWAFHFCNGKYIADEGEVVFPAPNIESITGDKEVDQDQLDYETDRGIKEFKEDETLVKETPNQFYGSSNT